MLPFVPPLGERAHVSRIAFVAPLHAHTCLPTPALLHIQAHTFGLCAKAKPPQSMSHYEDWYIDKNWDNGAAVATRPDDPTSIFLSSCFGKTPIAEPEFPELSEEEIVAYLQKIREPALQSSDASVVAPRRSQPNTSAPSAPRGSGKVGLPS